MGAKAAAAAAVAQLCREPGGLEALMEQPALLQVGLGVGWALHAPVVAVKTLQLGAAPPMLLVHIMHAHHHDIPSAL